MSFAHGVVSSAVGASVSELRTSVAVRFPAACPAAAGMVTGQAGDPAALPPGSAGPDDAGQAGPYYPTLV
jgi:hypothetical protein